MQKLALPVLAVLFAAGCLSGGSPLEGLALRNANDTGPGIVWDLFAEPLPEIPLPNDVGTRPDLTSATGRRVNLSTVAITQHERELRTLLGELEGFSTYSPLWVRFDRRIDLEDLLARQRNDDPADDAVYVVNLNPESDNYGQPMLLDFDDGRFPLVLEQTNKYFANDPRAHSSNLVFETVAEEDDNGNGVLDPIEDTDGDGTWDQPNTWGTYLGDAGRHHPVDDLISFYELETDTLLVRTVMPREELSTYAVILTRNLVGKEGGSPVRSPFAAVNHTQQTAALSPLLEDGILAALGVDLEDVAFAWTFTTQSVTGDIEALRAGLYGTGQFARLAQQFPARISHVPEIVEGPVPNPYILSAERLLTALEDEEFGSAVGLDPDEAAPTLEAYEHYADYVAMFRIESPALLDNEPEVFRIDRHSGDGDWGRETLYVACVVPRERSGFQAPFPVMFYSHGYTSFRFELLGFAGQLARFGIATCAIDAFGHGVPSSDFIVGLVKELLREQGLAKFAEEMFASRARDLNQDGATDSGGDFWTADLLHTRDVVRQTQLDQLQLVRVMRRFGATTMSVDVDGDGADEVAGDFNGDGVADFGGEQPYFIFGQSLGGIMAAVVGPVEPLIRASVPTSGGGGLAQLGMRSRQGGVVPAFFLPLFGPLIVGVPGSQGRMELTFDLLDVNREEQIRFARVPDPITGQMDELEVGDRVRVTNLDNGEIDEVVLREPAEPDAPVGEFRVHVAADELDRLRIDLFRADSATPYRTIDTFETPDLEEVGFHGEIYRVGDTLVSLQEGYGYRRGTPAMRRVGMLAQMAVDPADPINFARLHSEPITMRPDGAVPTNVLVINTVGDMNVPIDTGIAMARAAGLIGVRQIDPRYGKSQDQVLIDMRVIEGIERLNRFSGRDPCHYDPRQVLFDIDDTSEGLDPQQGPRLTEVALAPQCDGSPSEPAACGRCASMPPLRATRDYDWGVSGMRVPYVSPRGKHGFQPPNVNAVFDYNLFCINQVGWFFATGGTEIADDVCLAASTCDFLPL